MTLLTRFQVPNRTAARIACAVVGCGLAGTALAQPLPNVPGLTELQQPVAEAIMTLCPQLPPPNANGTPTQRLSNSCTLMVVTAAYNEGIPGFPPQFNLKISNAELATGVQAVAPVQMNAQKQISTEASKVNMIGSRLLDLRSGSRGFVVGVNGQEAQPATSAQVAKGDLQGASGGAASADTPLGGPWGGFLNLGYNWGNVDQTTLQDAYKYRNFNVLAGVDYRVSNSVVLGAAFSYGDTHSDYDQSLGSVKAATTGVVGYGTYYSDTWFLDGFLAYGGVNYDSVRNIFIPSNNPAAPAIQGSATASPKGDQWSAALGIGANYETGSMTVTPTLRLGYIWVKNKAFSESEPTSGLGLAVDSRTIRSLQSALGAKVSTTVGSSVGVFVPYFSAQWMHEFENDSPSIISKYVNDPTNTFFAIPTAGPTRDYAVLAVGSTATFPDNLTAFLQLGAAVGLQDATAYGLVLGLRKQF